VTPRTLRIRAVQRLLHVLNASPFVGIALRGFVVAWCCWLIALAHPRLLVWATAMFTEVRHVTIVSQVQALI
jgi:hypothetical protein